MSLHTPYTVRQPAVSGMFYPDNPGILKRIIDEYLQPGKSFETPPKALIVPHAGYQYSGPIAGVAYQSIMNSGSEITRVILLGPAHTLPFNGIATPGVSFFDTPFGRIPIDRVSINQIENRFAHVIQLERAHREEHSLEVQLPFLQTILREFMLVPLVVGDASPNEVAQVLDELWGEKETLILISSDLSHFHPYREAMVLDRRTAEFIESFHGDAMAEHSACGRISIQGLLLEAQSRNLTIKRLALRNSGDTAGDRRQVVGYGAWAFFE